MALNDIVRSGIATANRITASLQDFVTVEQWTGFTGFGVPTYGPAKSIKALVEKKNRQWTNAGGDIVISNTKVTFLQPLSDNGAAGRREPLDPRDRITLPGGIYGAVLSVEGLNDPKTSREYMFEVFLGDWHL